MTAPLQGRQALEAIAPVVPLAAAMLLDAVVGNGAKTSYHTVDAGGYWDAQWIFVVDAVLTDESQRQLRRAGFEVDGTGASLTGDKCGIAAWCALCLPTQARGAYKVARLGWLCRECSTK